MAASHTRFPLASGWECLAPSMLDDFLLPVAGSTYPMLDLQGRPLPKLLRSKPFPFLSHPWLTLCDLQLLRPP
jgi:hypothetical protein